MISESTLDILVYVIWGLRDLRHCDKFNPDSVVLSLSILTVDVIDSGKGFLPLTGFEHFRSVFCPILKLDFLILIDRFHDRIRFEFDFDFDI